MAGNNVAHDPEQSREILFLPDRYFGANAFTKSQTPGSGPFFPFPEPFVLDGLEHDYLFKLLHRAPISTGDKGASKTKSTFVKNMNKEGVKLRACHTMWDNLKLYADLGGEGVPRPSGFGARFRTRPFLRSCDASPLPAAKQQKENIMRLYAWYQAQSLRQDTVVTSEPAVQDTVLLQILDALDMLLQTRYENRVSLPLIDTPAGWVDVNGVVTGPPLNAFYPKIGRPCQRANDAPAPAGKRPGEPDFVLYRSGSLHDHGAVFEVKTWWVYTDEVLESIFSRDVANTETGRIRWELDSVPVSLLKQVWAEMRAYRTDWQATITGQSVMIGIKTGVAELTMTPPQAITETDVLEALIGLCFASVDEAWWWAEHELKIQEWICPKNERVVDW